jgi:hypothetical protein
MPSRPWDGEPMAPLKRRFFSAKVSPCPVQIVATAVCTCFFQFCEAYLELCFAKLSVYPVAGRSIVWTIFGENKVHHIERVPVRT